MAIMGFHKLPLNQTRNPHLLITGGGAGTRIRQGNPEPPETLGNDLKHPGTTGNNRKLPDLSGNNRERPETIGNITQKHPNDALTDALTT